MQDGGGRLYSQTSSNTTLFGDGLASIAAVRMLTIVGKVSRSFPNTAFIPSPFADAM